MSVDLPSPSCKALVVGGSGRVGGSVVRCLLRDGFDVCVTGRSEANYQSSLRRWRRLMGSSAASLLPRVQFQSLDLSDSDRLMRLLVQGNFDVVVNTAGPFQGKERAEVLEALLKSDLSSLPVYLDVCDDIELSMKVKARHEEAKQKGLTAIMSAGIWPGVSNLMGAQLKNLVETGGKGDSILEGGREKEKEKDQLEELAFFFHTAGSGNSGASLISATFLILAEQVLTYERGEKKFYPPFSDPKTINFGALIGEQEVFRMNLMEAHSCREALGVPSVSTRFGTAPPFWNQLLRAMAFLPSSLLRNRDLMEKLTLVSMPMIRLVDTFAGAKNGICVEARSKTGKRLVSRLEHKDLEACIGEAVAAFVAVSLQADPRLLSPGEGPAGGQGGKALAEVSRTLTNLRLPSGVWYPEDPAAFGSGARLKQVLEKIAQSAITSNTVSWDAETDRWVSIA